jgi:hypothetical protein
MLSDPDLLVWPVSSFDERGTLQSQAANLGTELGAGSSITAWTCQCLVDMSGYEEARVGLDVRRKIASVTGNNGGQVQTEQGYYLAALVATPPAAGTMGAASGMADHSLVAAIDCGDVLKVSHPTLTGPDYCEAHESRSDLTGPARITDGSAGALPMSRNLYQQRACVPLIAPARRAGKVTYSVVRLSAQPKFTSVIGGGGFPNGTHILHAMVQPHEKSELDYIASRSGIADSSGRYSISNRTQNGRKPHVESLPILPVMLSPPKAGGKTVNRAVKARGQ